MGGFRVRGVEIDRFSDGDGWVSDQGVEIGRFNVGMVVYGSGGGDW